MGKHLLGGPLHLGQEGTSSCVGQRTVLSVENVDHDTPYYARPSHVFSMDRFYIPYAMLAPLPLIEDQNSISTPKPLVGAPPWARISGEIYRVNKLGLTVLDDLHGLRAAATRRPPEGLNPSSAPGTIVSTPTTRSVVTVTYSKAANKRNQARPEASVVRCWMYHLDLEGFSEKLPELNKDVSKNTNKLTELQLRGPEGQRDDLRAR